MDITKEILEQRLKGLREQHAQLQADMNAIDGAMQTIEQLMEFESIKPEPVEEALGQSSDNKPDPKALQPNTNQDKASKRSRRVRRNK